MKRISTLCQTLLTLFNPKKMEEETNILQNLITQTIQTKYDTQQFLKNCYLIYKTTNHEDWAEQTQKKLRDPRIHRIIGFLQSLKEDTETRTLYYAPDKGEQDPLRYRPELEQEIISLELDQLQKLSQILRELQEEQEIEI